MVLPPRGDGLGVYWNDGRGIERVDYASISGRPGTKKHQDALQAAVQERLDVVRKLTELPPSDPDRATDPKRPQLYWGREDAAKDELVTTLDGYLVSRTIMVEIIAWDGADYGWRTSRVV